jgi:hypothetical protein
MKKVLEKLGMKEWQLRINRLQAEEGLSEFEARHKVVMEYMQWGDFKPLLWIIRESKFGLRGPALDLLAKMIAEGRLELKLDHGRPFNPKADEIGKLAADTYEDVLKYYDVKTEGLREAIADEAGISVETVKKAVTKRRKRK